MEPPRKWVCGTAERAARSSENRSLASSGGCRSGEFEHFEKLNNTLRFVKQNFTNRQNIFTNKKPLTHNARGLVYSLLQSAQPVRLRPPGHSDTQPEGCGYLVTGNPSVFLSTCLPCRRRREASQASVFPSRASRRSLLRSSGGVPQRSQRSRARRVLPSSDR